MRWLVEWAKWLERPRPRRYPRSGVGWGLWGVAGFYEFGILIVMLTLLMLALAAVAGGAILLGVAMLLFRLIRAAIRRWGWRRVAIISVISNPIGWLVGTILAALAFWPFVGWAMYRLTRWGLAWVRA